MVLPSPEKGNVTPVATAMPVPAAKTIVVTAEPSASVFQVPPPPRSLLNFGTRIIRSPVFLPRARRSLRLSLPFRVTLLLTGASLIAGVPVGPAPTGETETEQR